MTLYERCVDLQLKVEAAQSADAGGVLLASGVNLVESLDRASDYFTGAAQFRVVIATAERPAVDLKVVSKSVNGFRGALSSRGAVAFQQQHATHLTNAAKIQRELVVRWISTKWRALFGEYESEITRAQTEHLIGSAAHQRIARGRAQTLRTGMGLDPITNAEELQRVLGEDELAEWIVAIEKIGSELRQALEAINVEQAALTLEVSEALRRAATEGGLPLSELSTDLLNSIRLAGVDEHLVVRRQ
jgi:hypothetical protein